jgi:hypothetical protein
MESSQVNWIANFIWGIADDVLRDLFMRGLSARNQRKLFKLRR